VKKQYGRMVAIQGGQITSIPLDEAASKTKFLPVDHPIIQVARDIGICMGD
jgi:6-phosphofructokinase 1